MLDSIKIKLQYLFPKQVMTCLIGWLADQEAGWLTHVLIKSFIRYYKINMKEVLYPNPEHYKTFNEFFMRPLRNGMRPIADHPNGLVLPADGTISQLGTIEQDKILQAKGYHYSLEALLAGNYMLAKEFINGNFATIYLSPGDYHRIHMPCNGVLREMIYVPGDLFSLNHLMLGSVSNIFARNERLICIFDTNFGPIAQILVGATIVGSIETLWAGTINITREGIIKRWTYPKTGERAVILKKGEDMARFKLGSTVINLFATNRIEFTPTLVSGCKILMGGAFAHQSTITPVNSV
ncbi:archaetidylserine decarboxylase [Candidatus Profftia tarda]|uniref:Phosphatidylserine decarboxylase proenzyme n=1 Tax=Candidatus Profftia tarda TaxID=1177216 RepID=A0A8E4MEV5_9ENTR|nr:archaetidylserine decarboxylase [Candidatus Profftia tarda]CAD6511058.1 Phosphatidylserine decarboxylase proenzyme [Candidatus Profftia tarda]